MDVSPYLAIRPAPQVVLDQAAVRGAQPRFRVRDAAGAWVAVTWAELSTLRNKINNLRPQTMRRRPRGRIDGAAYSIGLNGAHSGVRQ